MRRMLIVGLGHIGSAYAEIAGTYKSEFKSNQKLEIWGHDTNKELIMNIGNGDHKLSEYLDYVDEDPGVANDATCIVICISTPTTEDRRIDASNITKMLKDMDLDPHIKIIIKSAVPVGFCDELVKTIANPIFYCPEFLREGKQATNDITKLKKIYLAYDAKKIGHSSNVDEVTKYLRVLNPNATVVVQASFKELEMMKLARNTYLAMRVSFFNEIYRLCSIDGIDAENIIEYMCGDSRIGDFYNTLSFGYGGYCLPKDTNELKAHAMDHINHSPTVVGFSLLKGITESNAEHLWFHARRIMEKAEGRKYVVFYGIGFKEESNNPNNSASKKLIDILLMYTNLNIKLIKSEEYEYTTTSERLIMSSPEDVQPGDLIVVQWQIDEAFMKFAKDCEIYHPRMI